MEQVSFLFKSFDLFQKLGTIPAPVGDYSTVEGDNTHLTPTVNQELLGVIQQTPPRRTSTPEQGSQPHPVIVRSNSNPSTPGVSLDWDNSCLEEAFHAGGQYLSVPGIQQRRRSSTNPDIVDNNQILLVDTDVSSLDSSLERTVQLAGNIPSSVLPTVSTTMEEEADNIYEEVDSIMGKLTVNPVSAMTEELLDSSLATFDAIKEDAEHCMKIYNSWKRKHRASSDTELKREVNEAVDGMQNAFQAYSSGFSDKKKQLQPAPVPVVGLQTMALGISSDTFREERGHQLPEQLQVEPYPR